jgi:hypothetical protein
VYLFLGGSIKIDPKSRTEANLFHRRQQQRQIEFFSSKKAHNDAAVARIMAFDIIRVGQH